MSNRSRAIVVRRFPAHVETLENRTLFAVSLGEDGWTLFTPSGDTRTVYVSASQGNDNNNGLSPSAPVRTIGKGKSLIRDGSPDWLLLKRGDVFNEPVGRWMTSGRNSQEPQLIGGYGSGDRPLINSGVVEGFVTYGGNPVNHVAITGLHFLADKYDGTNGGFNTSGIRLLRQGSGYIIEDVMVQGYKDNIVIQGDGTAISNLQLRRSVIVDAYASSSVGYAQGMYVAGSTRDVIIEQNVFDHNGWRGNAFPATFHNHNLYIQVGTQGMTVRDNIVTRASLTGISMRNGGVIEKNLIARNPVGMLVANGESRVTDNIILEGVDQPAFSSGVGIDAVSLPSLIARNNIIANDASAFSGNVSAIQLQHSINNADISSNIIYNWRRGIRNGGGSNIRISQNQIQDLRSTLPLIQQNTSSGSSYAANTYNSTYTRPFRRLDVERTFAQWQGEAPEADAQWHKVQYTAPNRTLATYNAHLGGAESFDSWISAARSTSKQNWHPQYTASAANAYIREGFGDGSTAAPNTAPAATITTPITGSRYSGGETIHFTGAGSDQEDGALPASAYTWSIVLHHDSGTQTLATVRNTTSGSFEVPRAGVTSANQFYRVSLTVIDSAGAHATTHVDVLPRTATITLASNIADMPLQLDGQALATPASVLGVSGMTRTLSAAPQQTVAGKMYEFVSWSDGGAATHEITTPQSGATYTATYREVTSSSTTLSAVADAFVQDGTVAGSNFGLSPELRVKAASSGYIRETYLKFDLSNIDAIDSAKLRLFGRLSSTDATNIATGIYAVADSTWGEESITYNNRPASGTTALASVTVTDNVGRWYEWDLTDHLRREKSAGRNVVSVALKNLVTAPPFTIFNSDEAAADRPQLLITAASSAPAPAPSPDPEPSPTPEPPPPAPTPAVTIGAAADSFVRDGSFSGTNYGKDTQLHVKLGPSGFNRHTYLRFDLSSVTTINNAKLRLFGQLSDNRASNIVTAVYGAADKWNENNLTWKNRPAVNTTAVAQATVTDATARWYEWDLTSYLRQQKAAGKNVVTLALQNLNSGEPHTTFNSRQALSNRPELVVS